MPHRLFHLAHGAFHADQDGTRDDAVADVQLAQQRQVQQLAHVGVGDAVAGVQAQADLGGGVGRLL